MNVIKKYLKRILPVQLTNGIKKIRYPNSYYPPIKKSHWKTIHYKGFTYEIFLDKEFGIISNIIEKDGIYEPEILDFISERINQEGVFLDIGANIGQHSIVISRFCKKVFSFEPISILQNKILQNIAKNNIQNIELNKFGLGNESTESEMIILKNNIGKSKPKHRNENEFENLKNNWAKEKGNILETEKIELKRLDDLNFEQINFIKIDVEGYELFVLEGGKNTILRTKPKIILEYSPIFYESMEKGMSERLYNFIIQELNYTINIIEKDKLIKVNSFSELPFSQWNIYLEAK